MGKLNILFQDEYYIACEKPAGILVHPYKERDRDRRSIMRSLKKQTNLYLYPIHRLDKQVSGVVIFGLSKEATRSIKENWHAQSTQKKYIALCRGTTDAEGTHDFPLKSEKGIQEAVTHYRRIGSNERVSLMDIRIETGRKHQIRKHFSRRMNNLIGDSAHGNGEINRLFKSEYKLFRIFLHAYELSFIHPYSQNKIQIKCPLPSELQKVLNGEKINIFNTLD